MRIQERLLACARNTPLLKKCVAPVRPENRLVFIGRKLCELDGPDAIVPEKFCDNTVTTTKYTPWNFIFKNLYEQFMRIANFYFLIVTFIMFFVPNTPVSPLTSAIPLAFVLLVTAVKQAYEDWLRRKEDEVVNYMPCQVVKDGKLETVNSYEIQVGDIVKVKDKEQFPCDLVALSSSDEQGQCTIQTANLDGETNLKTFLCLPDTCQANTPGKLDSLRGFIDCQQPITDLYRFLGKMTVYKEDSSHVTKALQAHNVLLRGAKLKHTDYVFGCAVYTGSDTKLALNSDIKSGKRSSVEKMLNAYLIVFMVYMFLQCALATLLRHLSLANEWRNPDGTRDQWYIPFLFDYNNEEGRATSMQGFFDFLYFYIILNYVIPISLYVTIELQKFFGSLFFTLDIDLYDAQINERAKANTSDLNEELGQVEYLFCDKTGTLTENTMQFRQCSVGGKLWWERDGTFERNRSLEMDLQEHRSRRASRVNSSGSQTTGDVERLSDSGRETSEISKFFEVLSLCHTVRIELKPAPLVPFGNSCTSEGTTIDISSGSMPDNPSDVTTDSVPVARSRSDKKIDVVDASCGANYEYHASSPDEKALVEASRLFGVVYHGLKDNKLTVTFNSKERKYILHETLDFDSDRKCMSVIIENDLGEYQVLCKGAESSVLKKCIAGPIDETIEHVDTYASMGLRTLVIASKTISADEMKRLTSIIEAARQNLTNRDEALVQAFAEAEQGFTVLGATAVEDKLQDGVRETIEKLRIAGIKVWVLTGDKEETAVNISYSAGHIDSNMSLLGFTLQTSEASAYTNLLSLNDSLNALELEGKEVALVVDGASLAMILNRYSQKFQEICLRCSTVLCCRMTPIQKSSVVKLVKESKSNPTTAAIGDGGNDVSMIQEAHVGIGIMGKEGRQAARSSDFAFGRFRFLQKTILVHGHNYYVRLAILVQYFFYKNVAFITANFWYIFFSAYSATSVYDTLFLTFYNMTFTSLPIYLYGLFEKDIPPKTLLNNPELYRKMRRNVLLNPQHFVLWNLVGFWHSFVTFFGVFLVYYVQHELGVHGKETDVATFGTAILFICSTSVNVKLMIVTYNWTWITVAGYLITFIGNWAMVAIYCAWTSAFTVETSMWGVLGVLFGSGVFWWISIILVILSVLPDIVARAWCDMSDPIYMSMAKAKPMIKKSNHVMFINSNESVLEQVGGHDDGIAIIGHRYVGDQADLRPASDLGGGHNNPAMIVDE
ncbi:phospholipid-transporting ATPase IF-like isoform X2 [Watersipora subatra]|uniref:phospholipid-transporting ATPase IF-like isoform X2 n=1 Tax=Watersipora subatra TaxID=2589382 RepID=UPI00355B6F53